MSAMSPCQRKPTLLQEYLFWTLCLETEKGNPFVWANTNATWMVVLQAVDNSCQFVLLSMCGSYWVVKKGRIYIPAQNHWWSLYLLSSWHFGTFPRQDHKVVFILLWVEINSKRRQDISLCHIDHVSQGWP